MNRALLLLAAAPALLAHIGSPDVFLEGPAGPYPLFVTVRPPVVIPGVAQIEVRSAVAGLDALYVTPMPLTGPGARLAPTADRLASSSADPQFFTGSLWIMTSGSWQVRIQAHGPRGRGALAVPIPALAVRLGRMQAGVGLLLALLGLVLSAGIVSIIGAGVRESPLEPGDAPSPERRRLARRAMTSAAVIVFFLLYLGNRWWNAEAGFIERFLYQPVALEPSLDPPALNPPGRLLLRLRETARQRFPRPLDQLLPDHGHLMHLFVARLPALDRVWHLHPDQLEAGLFVHHLPAMPAGRYALFADIVWPNGLPETATAEIDLPAIPGRPLTGDDASGDFPAPLTWERDSTPLRARRPASFRFRLNPPDGLELYMGMPGHAFFLKTDRSVFAHVHPTGSVPMASLQLAGADPHAAHTTAPPPVISFPYGFPQPGDYRIFVQIKRRGRIETAVFDARVEP